MIVPDVNLLVHTLNRDSPQCARAGDWWRKLLNGDEPVGLAWSTVVGVVRISTNPRIFPSPIALVDVLENVDEWFAQPVVSSIEPGAQHWSIMRRLLAEAGRGIVDELGRHEVVVLLFGLQHRGDGNGVGFGAGGDVDFPDEMLGGGDVDVVAEVDLGVVDALGGVRVGGRAQAIAALLGFR